MLAIISKLSGPGGRPTTDSTIDSVQRALKEIYNKDLTKREVEYILQDLQDRGFIFKEKGLLRDGRLVLYGIKPRKIAQEAFTLIKINPERAYIHNGYEGLVYDPPSLSDTSPAPREWVSKLSKGMAESMFGRDGSLELLQGAAAFLRSPECDAVLKGIVSLFMNQNAQAPDPVGDVQHSPQAPLAPKHTLDSGPVGKFVGPNGEITYRLS